MCRAEHKIHLQECLGFCSARIETETSGRRIDTETVDKSNPDLGPQPRNIMQQRAIIDHTNLTWDRRPFRQDEGRVCSGHRRCGSRTAGKARCSSRGRRRRGRDSWSRHRSRLPCRRSRRRRHRRRRPPTRSSPSSAKPTATAWKPEARTLSSNHHLETPPRRHSRTVSRFTSHVHGVTNNRTSAQPNVIQSDLEAIPSSWTSLYWYNGLGSISVRAAPRRPRPSAPPSPRFLHSCRDLYAWRAHTHVHIIYIQPARVYMWERNTAGPPDERRYTN